MPEEPCPVEAGSVLSYTACCAQDRADSTQYMLEGQCLTCGACIHTPHTYTGCMAIQSLCLCLWCVHTQAAGLYSPCACACGAYIHRLQGYTVPVPVVRTYTGCRAIQSLCLWCVHTQVAGLYSHCALWLHTCTYHIHRLHGHSSPCTSQCYSSYA